MNFNIHTFQLIAKILLKQQNLNQIRCCLTGHIQIFFFVSLIKRLKYFNRLSNSKLLSFMTKVNPDNGNETKSNTFSWEIFKSQIIFYWSQSPKIFQ